MNTKPWVRYCSISTCGNFKGTTDKNVPVFRLPVDQPRREKWICAIRNFEPTLRTEIIHTSRLCRLHFDSEDIQTRHEQYGVSFRLKPNAIPKHFKPNSDPLGPSTLDCSTIKEESVQRDNKRIVRIISNGEPRQLMRLKKVKSNCTKCIQTDVELQKLRDRISQLEQQLADKSRLLTNARLEMRSFGPPITECNVCQADLSAEELISHLCHVKELECQYCSQLFDATRKLLEHLETAHDDKQFYECDRCARQFATIQLYNIHVNTHSVEPKYSCEKSDEMLFLESCLEQQVSDEHTEPEPSFTVISLQSRNETLKIEPEVASTLKLFQCGTCDECFDTARQLQTHMNKTHVEVKKIEIKKRERKIHSYECYVCKHQMRSKRETMKHLNAHFRKVIEKPVGKCSVCSKHLTKTDLDTHLCRPDDKSIDCEYCSERFSSIQTLLAHVESNHPDRKFFKCSVCSRLFSMKLLFDFHRASHVKRDRIHKCHICPKSFYEALGLKKHLDVHAITEKTHLCDECGKAFRTVRYLRIHKRSHTEPTIQCPDCPQIFRRMDYLKRHQMTHQNSKYICHICDAELETVTTLNSHSKIHQRTEADRCFACTECPQKFFKKSSLKSHLVKVHSSIKQYQCTYCDAAYKHNGDLNKHLRTHLGDDMYHCPKCPKRFRLSHLLQRHSYDHYKEEQEMHEGETDMDTT